MKLILLLLCFALASLAQGSAWTKEPTEFKSIPFAATLDEAKTTGILGNCRQRDGDETCLLRIRFSDDADIVCEFTYKHQSFQGVLGRFSSEHYAEVRSAFIDKYGHPSTTTHETLQNAAGATFDQEHLAWNGKRIVLRLSRFGEEADESIIWFVPVSVLEEWQSKHDQQRRDALK